MGSSKKQICRKKIKVNLDSKEKEKWPKKILINSLKEKAKSKMDLFAFQTLKMYTPGTTLSTDLTTKSTMVATTWEKLFAQKTIQQKHQEFTCLLTMVDSKLIKLDTPMPWVSTTFLKLKHGELTNKKWLTFKPNLMSKK